MSNAIGAIFFLLIYFLPSLAAEKRRHRNAGAILILNLLLGWTLIGWVVALVWSQTYQPPAEPKPVTPPPVEPSPSLLARMSDPTEVRPERTFRDLDPRDFKWVD